LPVRCAPPTPVGGGADQPRPARVAAGADVAHPAADIAEADAVVRVGDAESTTRPGVPVRRRPEARHAGGGQLVAETEADVRSGRSALDQRLDVIRTRRGDS